MTRNIIAEAIEKTMCNPVELVSIKVTVNRDENYSSHTMTTSAKFELTYSDGSNETIETVSNNADIQIPSTEIAYFMHTAKHQWNSNCYWYTEEVYTATPETKKVFKEVSTPATPATQQAPAMGCIVEVSFNDNDNTFLQIWRRPTKEGACFYTFSVESKSCHISSTYQTFEEVVESFQYTLDKKAVEAEYTISTDRLTVNEKKVVFSTPDEAPADPEKSSIELSTKLSDSFKNYSKLFKKYGITPADIDDMNYDINSGRYTMQCTVTRYTKQPGYKTFSGATIETEKFNISAEFYYNCITGIQFFHDKVVKSYTPAGNIITSLTCYNPDKTVKMVRTFKIINN